MIKAFVLITAILLKVFFCSAQSYVDLVKQADDSAQAKNYKAALKIYNKAFRLEKNNPDDLYSAACMAALSGAEKEAFRLLDLSIDNGWINIYHLKEDKDLSALHNKKQWNTIVSKLQVIVDKVEINYDKPLQRELLDIYNDDQLIRREYLDSAGKLGYNSPVLDSLGEVMYVKDSINVEKIVKILDAKGWVGKDKIGKRANTTLFLVIQHADIEVQKKYLPLMKDAVTKGNASGKELALLVDRIALGEGKKQIYGSQLGTHPQTGKFYIRPLDDPDNVDKRRATVGLGSLADYAKTWGLIWDVEEYKKQLPEIEKIDAHE